MRVIISTSMPNLRPSDVGIPKCFIFISKRVPGHDPRIKVSHHVLTSRDDHDAISIHIETLEVKAGNPELLTTTQYSKVIQWMMLNQQVLLDLWYKPEVSYKQAFSKLKPLK